MSIMSDSVRQEVLQFLDKLENPITATFYPKTNDPASDAMQQLLEELGRLTPQFRVDTQDGVPEPVYPETAADMQSSVTVLARTGSKSGVRYLGFPGGHEFGTFLEDLLLLSTEGPSGLSPETLAFVEGLQTPIHLQVFVTPT